VSGRRNRATIAHAWAASITTGADRAVPISTGITADSGLPSLPERDIERVMAAYSQRHSAEPGCELGGGHHGENPVTLHRALA
jgi:hypothetical protein